MSRLGTYTTYDAPATKRDAEALQWLKDKFEPMDARVYQLLNPHDFGSYPSYEVDYPRAVEQAINTLEEEELDNINLNSEQAQALEDIRDKFHSQADEITEQYSRIFFS